MAAPAILKIDIIADATKAQSALKGAGDTAQTTGSKLKGVAKAAATGFAVGAVVSFGKSAVSAARDAEKSTKALHEVFRSMGDTTGKAADQAEKMAGSFSKQAGIDDDVIMGAQTLLATFGNVSNETARTAGIFDSATVAAADLAAAGFGDMNSNAKMLGKALNDPVKGLTAMSKAGVTFTQQQKDQIAAMVKSGDMLGAQQIIMGEVQKQVGGTAVATADAGDKMTVAFGETTEAIGGALLPVMNKLAPILASVAQFIQDNINWLGPLVGAVLAVAAAVWVWNAAMAANPITLIAIGVAALIAGIILLVKNWDKVTAAFRAAFNWVKANWPLLLAILTGPIGAAVVLIVKNWDTVKGALAAVWNWIRGVWGQLTAILTAPFTAAWHAISGVIDKVRGAVDSVIGFAREMGSRLAGLIKGPLNAVIRAWNGLQFKVPEVNVGPIHFGGQTIGLPDIPELARGGAVVRTGLALVHAGETFSGVGRSLGGNTVINVNVTTAGLGADSPQIQRAVVNALRGYVGRNGPLDVPTRSVA